MNIHFWSSAIVRSILFCTAISFSVNAIQAQGRYCVQAGDKPEAGSQITTVDNITMTFGATGDADFQEAIPSEEINGYTAFTHGNGINPSPNKGSVPTTGTFYVFEPAKDGAIEMAVFHHKNNKPLYILEDGIVMDHFNGIVVNGDYKGTYTFDVKAGKRYIAYCSGSKMGFFGFNYSVNGENDDPDDPTEDPDDPQEDPDDPVINPAIIGDIYDTNTLSPYDANRPLGFGEKVKGSEGKNPVTVTMLDELTHALEGDTPTTIYISGNITLNKMINVGSYKSIFGLPGASLTNMNQDKNAGILNITGNQVIVRNLTFLGPGAYDIDGNDDITLNGATNVWIDHCDIQDGMDGNMDIVNGADNICISWTRFRYLIPPRAGGSGGSNDHRNCNLVGNSDTNRYDPGKLNCTFVSCWWDEGCKERCPRVRFGQVHVVNSLYTSNDFNYCVGYGANSNIYVENCNFYSEKAKKNYIKSYNNGYSYNITVTGCMGGADVRKRSGTNDYFEPSGHYTLEAYDVEQVFNALTDTDSGAGPTLDLIPIEGSATIINHNPLIKTDESIYNLQGQRIKRPFQGIYVKNGRKYIVSANQ